jgi:hypothetical protein
LLKLDDETTSQTQAVGRGQLIDIQSELLPGVIRLTAAV